MSGIFLRWGVPAFVTVIGGTAAAIATSGAAIPTDLATRAQAIVAAPQYDWATLAFDMRDATISGTATTQAMIDDVVAKVGGIHGVRSVTSKVVLAEYVSPFPFIATVEGGAINLSGGLPDEAARAQLLALAGEGVHDETRPMSGAPNRADWLAAVDYALGYVAQLDEGEVALADLDLTVSGRAKSPEAYDALNRLAAEPVPASVKLAYREVQPALQSPFEWRADYDGSRLNLSGAAPTEAFIAELENIIPAGASASTSLVLASGAPSGFETTAKLLLQNLLKLERGSAVISDATSALSGSPADPATAESVRVAMTPSGTTVTLGPPLVSEYWFSAERTTDGIVLDGFVPDASARDRLEALDGVDAAGLELGRGAPERFQSAVDFVIGTLGRMSEGHATIQGTILTLDGRAATIEDFTAVESILKQGVPQGLALAAANIKPPLATPFTFTAEKSADGLFSLSGHVPSEAVRKALAGALPEPATDTTVIADGNPEDFEAAAAKALGVLPLLDSGKVNYDGDSWSLIGAVDTPQRAFAAETAFAATGLRTAGWTYTVTLPPATEAAVPPVVDPYVWRAQKSANGSVAFSGFVPTEQLKRYLAAHAGASVVDGTALGGGAPDGFIPAVIAGLDALLAMDEGALDLTAGNWSLTGKVAATATRHAVETTLHSAVDTAAWHVAIQAADAAPVVSPFVWSAAKTSDGSYTFSGYVPTEELRRLVAVRAGKVAKDTTLVGSGEPGGFITDSLAGLDALLKLESGELRYDGNGWSISGQPITPADAVAAKAALATATDGGASWKTAIADPSQGAEAPAAVASPTAEPQPAAPAATEIAAAPTPETAVAAAEEEPTENSTEAAVAPEAVPVETEVAHAEPAATAVRSYVFEATKAPGGVVAFKGSVPAEPMRRYLAVITGGEPSADLTIGSGLPADFITNANAGSRALALLADGEFGLDGDKWVFSGRAETEADRRAALAALAVVPMLNEWETNVTLLPPLMVCREKVGAFAARNAILFQSGSALIAEGSLPAIDELAGYLALCPEATVNVEGHTDADGDDEANLALSVSRAEAVVDALILRGIGPERLYAIGYGESVPVASNETRAGKQANRRIAFTLADE
ncbi:MAG: OmpA family protein [Devosia sp.]|uniref:OmpA family protein n=1 Tax=Devosia sp. TaxID=1871048 RepID=UPI00262BA63A|nr:OmpA family protein [Devosia sp.]MDB5542801.1 OmpA family protein [Devosia sp.]